MTDLQTPNYTHSMHAKACRDAAQARVPLKVFVQVQMQKVTCCAVIRDALDIDDAPMWKVEIFDDAFKGVRTVPVRNVRQCSGTDGRCHCEKSF
jgi:hypothetical protein